MGYPVFMGYPAVSLKQPAPFAIVSTISLLSLKTPERLKAPSTELFDNVRQ